jgi:hypothetical protein
MAEKVVKALTEHWGLKLVALCVASALWLFVMMAEKADLVLSAPIELHSIPPGLEVGERPDNVDVQVNGLRGTLARLGSDSVRARVSLAGVRAGEVTLRLQPEQIVVPPGVTVLRISPSRVRIVLAPSRQSRTEWPGPAFRAERS